MGGLETGRLPRVSLARSSLLTAAPMLPFDQSEDGPPVFGGHARLSGSYSGSHSSGAAFLTSLLTGRLGKGLAEHRTVRAEALMALAKAE